jgi:hypothetical protein
MSQQNSLFKGVLGTVGGIALFVGLILAFNVWFWLSEGSPTIPQFEGRWWAGYYETTLFGRQWCVARFIKAPSGRLQMALLSPAGAPDFYDVDRSSSDHTFVYLTFTDNEAKPAIRIDAKQLYVGKRYYWGRLINWRFHDFWKMNDDVRITGNIVSWTPPQEFGIEPISDDRLEVFWKRYVRPEQPTPSPADILRAAGK